MHVNSAYQVIAQLRGSTELLDSKALKTSNYRGDYVHVIFIEKLETNERRLGNSTRVILARILHLAVFVGHSGGKH